MREFKTSPFGIVVDLDNPETYNHLPDTLEELESYMFKEIGIAYCYMNYFHPEWYNEDSIQRIRVTKLVKIFTRFRSKNFTNKQWYKEQIFMFEDETENMC